MAEPLDILDQRDPLTLPFLGSVMVHAAVIACLFVGWYWMNRVRTTFGDVNAGGGPAYTVSPVHSIPIPRREAPPNPVANDTQSMVPTAPAPKTVEKKQSVADKNAIEIPDKTKREAPRPLHKQQYVPPAPPNQVYSRAPQALSNTMYGGPTGSGRVGIGPNTPLGDNRLGAYAALIRDRIAQNWQTAGLDERSQRAPAMVGFVIMRDGSVRNVQLLASSGNPNIDDTALRAVMQSNPLPGLPPQVAENSITAQFTFNLH